MLRRLIFLLIPVAALGQTSAYQSTDSNSSIIIANASANVVFNVADTKFTVGYLHEPGDDGLLWGLSVFGKPSTSFSSQIFNSSTQNDIGGTLSLGRRGVLYKKLDLTHDWFVFQATYSRSAAELVADANTQPEKRTFDGLKGMLTYNGYVPAGKTTLLFGLSAGVSKSNNIDDLTSVTINKSVLQSADGVNPAFQVVNSVTGYTGVYKTYVGAPIYTDFAILPHPDKLQWLSLDLFTRSNAAHVNRYVEGGVGLFVAQPGAPTKVLGGVTLAWKNGAPTIGIVAGWAF